MTNQREAALNEFIKLHGWDHFAREFLAGDASNRRYERLIDLASGRSGVLMDAPPEKGEDVRSFVHIAKQLKDQGFSAPEIFHADVDQGFLLIEDLGDALFARVCDGDPDQEETLYNAAIDLLVEAHGQAAPTDLSPYDEKTYVREAMLFLDWYIPAVTGAKPNQKMIDEYTSLIKQACGQLDTNAPILVQRDYHAENLLWLPDRQGHARVGLLDFQDALAGHRAYDLVSLLEDARRDTSDLMKKNLFGRYVTQSGVDVASFQRDYNILGAQRNLKIMGIFARLCIRDGKWSYVDLMPRVWDHLMGDLCAPELADLKTWVLANAPPPETDVCTAIKAQANA